MAADKRPPFMWKAFTSFTISLAFIGLLASGIVLYIAPAGRVANWSGWTFGALERAQWQAVHTIVALAFILAAVMHLVFNWRVLLAYLKSRTAVSGGRWRELSVASAAMLLVVAFTVRGAAPFSTVMSAGERVRATWAEGNEPPIPHAEILTFARLAETTRVPLDPMMANAKSAGVAATSETTLAEVSRALGVTPAEAFRRVTAGQKRPKPSIAEGGGWGQKTVEQVCRQMETPVEAGLARLRAAGFDAAADNNIRELALRHGRTPIEVVTAISEDRSH